MIMLWLHWIIILVQQLSCLYNDEIWTSVHKKMLIQHNFFVDF